MGVLSTSNGSLAIVTCVAIITIFASINISEYNGNNKMIEMAKTGLEQCPKDGKGSNSLPPVWVKDCKSYIQIVRSSE